MRKGSLAAGSRKGSNSSTSSGGDGDSYGPNSGNDLGSRKGSGASAGVPTDNNNETTSSRRGSRLGSGTAAPSTGGGDAKNKNAAAAPAFDVDEDGYAIGEGKKQGKGLAALKHRADSLTRLGKKNMDAAADMNNKGMAYMHIAFF